MLLAAAVWVWLTKFTRQDCTSAKLYIYNSPQFQQKHVNTEVRGCPVIIRQQDCCTLTRACFTMRPAGMRMLWTSRKLRDAALAPILTCPVSWCSMNGIAGVACFGLWDMHWWTILGGQADPPGGRPNDRSRGVGRVKQGGSTPRPPRQIGPWLKVCYSHSVLKSFCYLLCLNNSFCKHVVSCYDIYIILLWASIIKFLTKQGNIG